MARRRQRGEGSLFQRHDHPTCPLLQDGPPDKSGKPTRVRPKHACKGTWVGRVDLGWADGKRQRKTVYARSQIACVRKLRDARKAVDQGDRNTRTQTTATWLQTWLQDICPPRVKPQTLNHYRSMVRLYLVPAIGKVRLDRLALQHVRQVHQHVASKGCSPGTVGVAHRVLNNALNDAVREGILARNPAAYVPKPASNGRQTRRALSMVEVRGLFDAVEGDRLASRWHTAFLLGLRQGECLGLRWSALELDVGVADIATQLQRIPYRHGCDPPCGRKRADRCPDRELDVQPGFDYERLDGNLCLQRPKTDGSTRLVPLPEPLVVSLQARHELYLAERDQYQVDHGLVWVRANGRPIDSSVDRKVWHAALAAASVVDTAQHSARHTASTLLLELGVSEAVRMSILGHSEAATTRGYTHVDLTLQRKAVGQLGSALLRPLSQ